MGREREKEIQRQIRRDGQLDIEIQRQSGKEGWRDSDTDGKREDREA
jgi:hypothetical protein